MAAKHVVFAALVATMWPLVALAGAKDNDAQIKALSEQAQAAAAAGNWQGLADTMNQLLPIDGRWSNYQALGNAEYNLGQYQAAADALDKGVAGALEDKTTPHPTIKTALSQMFMAKGHALEQLQKYDDAITSFTEASEEMDNPGQAYFSICALEYNQSLTTLDPLRACNKAIDSDPTLADAYFIKGSILIAQATVDTKGKQTFPPGTFEALQKYIDLAPDGDHAQDARDLLSAAKKH